MIIQKQRSQKRFGTVIFAVAVLAFLAITSVIAFTGFSAHSEIEDKSIANLENSPKNWNTAESKQVVANSTLTGEVIESKYIQFTVSVTNANSGDGVYVTHLASYLSEDDKESGFVPLAANSLEYSYTPDDGDSWTKLKLNAPSTDENAFKLGSDLHLGTLGTATDTVYFRFYVEPGKDVKKVNNKVSFLLKNSKSEVGYTSSIATIAYEDAILAAKTKEIAKVEADENVAEGSYADPLGMFSFIPGVDVVTSVIGDSTGINQEVLVAGMVAIIAGLGVFVICLITYIPIARKK